MSDRILNIAELTHLGTLAGWIKEGRTVKWAIDGDVTRLMTGVLRHFVREPERMGFIGPNDDVRDAYVRISAGMEWVLPVRDVVLLMDDTLFVVER
jgi:hypothetical protein